jgi:hypothetical protein
VQGPLKKGQPGKITNKRIIRNSMPVPPKNGVPQPAFKSAINIHSFLISLIILLIYYMPSNRVWLQVLHIWLLK